MMGLANRVGKLESARSLCPLCGRREPIRLVEVVLPPSPLDRPLDHATPGERATVEAVTAVLVGRAKGRAA